MPSPTVLIDESSNALADELHNFLTDGLVHGNIAGAMARIGATGGNSSIASTGGETSLKTSGGDATISGDTN